MSNNNEHYASDFWFTGPHTTFHHQHFQMVDLMIMNFKRRMCGLSPCAVPYEPERHNDNMSSEIEEELKVKVEEWIKPTEHVRRDSNEKQHDANVGRKIINRHE